MRRNSRHECREEDRMTRRGRGNPETGRERYRGVPLRSFLAEGDLTMTPVSRVERDFGGEEERASPGGILRKVYFLLGGRGRTAIADIENAACQVHPLHAQRITPLDRDIVPHPRLVAAGSQYVGITRNRNHAPVCGDVTPVCAKQRMDAIARVVSRLYLPGHRPSFSVRCDQ